MRASEIITIYLAAGSPFGVSYFLHQKQNIGRLQVLLKSTGAMILWPMMALILLARRLHSKTPASYTEPQTHPAALDQKIERAKGKLLAALHRVHDSLSGPAGQFSEELEQATRSISESIEQYVGLSLAVAEIDGEAEPGERALELCRIAGRTGDDLLLAGRCLLRRNAARLLDHRARARTELLHELATVREFGNQHRSARLLKASTARHLSVATLRFYAHAINLLSLLEDESAARSVARLLNAECARLRRLEAEGPHTEHQLASGETQCRTQVLHTPQAPLSSRETLAQG